MPVRDPGKITREESTEVERDDGVIVGIEAAMKETVLTTFPSGVNLTAYLSLIWVHSIPVVHFV